MRRVVVGDIMTRKFVSANKDSSLHDCAKIMCKENVNSVLLTNNKRLLGILTAKDILKIITKKPGLDLKKIKAIEMATKKVAVIKPSADISQVLAKMKALNFRRLPVLSNGEVIGVITLKDILAVEPELYSEVQTLLDEIREEERKIRETESEWPSEGICENCGSFSELLKVDGILLCPDCRDEMH